MAPGWSPCTCITLGLCVTRILSLLPSSLHGAGAGGGRTRRRLKKQSPIYSSTIFEPMKRQSPLLRGGHSLDQASSFPAGLDTQSRKPSEEDSCPSRGQRVCTPDTPAHAPARTCAWRHTRPHTRPHAPADVWGLAAWRRPGRTRPSNVTLALSFCLF